MGSKTWKILAVVIAVAAIGYLAARSNLLTGAATPQDFSQARLQGAMIAQSIVDLSNKSADDLKKVNELDKNGDYKQALDLTTQLINQSQEIRNQAVELSNELGKMIQSLSGIKSFDARQAALEGISSRLALISRLINYGDYLSQLLTVLQKKFSGVSGDHQVQTLVDQINSEVTAINSFNRQATDSMNRFDQITK